MTTFMNPKYLGSNSRSHVVDKPALIMTSSGAASADESRKDQLREIYHTAFLLRKKLIPDVVSSILRYAGMFERHAFGSRTTQPLVVRERSTPLTCFVTPPVQSSARVQYPVQKIVFIISSCDQGWADNLHGGSWTWFTAGIVPASTSNAEASCGNSHERDRFLDRERQIFRNTIASSRYTNHIVEWSADSDDDEERKWVSGLKNGDMIAVRAWAHFAGWENNVRSVSVVIYTTAVV